MRTRSSAAAEKQAQAPQTKASGEAVTVANEAAPQSVSTSEVRFGYIHCLFIAPVIGSLVGSHLSLCAGGGCRHHGRGQPDAAADGATGGQLRPQSGQASFEALLGVKKSRQMLPHKGAIEVANITSKKGRALAYVLSHHPSLEDTSAC